VVPVPPEDEVRLLSRLVGWPVETRDGEHLGRVRDFSVELGPPRPRVRRLLVRRSARTGYLVPCDDVVPATGSRRLRTRQDPDLVSVDPAHPDLDEGEVLLWRDVMDTQVVDLAGHRLARVSDVLLRRGEGGLEVVAVDLGVAGLLRRLGLGGWVSHAPGHLVDWTDLHLTSPRGHAVQLATSEAAFQALDAHGLAQLLARLSTPAAADVVRASEPAQAAAALHHSHQQTAQRLVHALASDDRSRLLAAAHADHAGTIRGVGPPAVPPRRRYRRTAGWRLHRPPAS
jgi:sporulation protein YlmC with PRC-barrel domain